MAVTVEPADLAGARRHPFRFIDGGTAVFAIIAWVAAGFILVLMGLIVWMSFVPGLPGDPGFTLANYADLFGQRTLYKAFGNSFIIGAGTIAINLVFAVPIAWLVERTDMPGKPLIVTLIAVSVLIPGFLKAMAWILLMSPQIGIINRLAIDAFGATAPPFNIYGLGGVILVQGLTFTPEMFFLISGSMKSLDPSLEEAAQAAGASRLKALLRVTVPLMRPAILAAVIYNLVAAVSLYEVAALLLGGRIPVLSTELFLNVRSAGGSINLAYAAVYAVLMMGLGLIALWLYGRVLKRGDQFAVVSGKAYRPALVPLGRWKWAGLAYVALFLFLTEFLPLLTLLWMSLLRSLELPSFHMLSAIRFDQYARVWTTVGGWPVLSNTLLLTVSTAILATGVSLAISMIAVRSKLRGRGVLDMIAMMPHVVPGIAFGFALLVFGILLNRFLHIPLYGSVGIILLGVLVERIPYCTRITNAALLQLHKEIDEAAAICGATRLATLGRIIAPLIAPSLAYAAIWVALLSLREVTIPLLLSGPSNTVVSVRVWTLWETGQYGAASAIGVSMFAIMAVLLLFARYAFQAGGWLRRAPDPAS